MIRKLLRGTIIVAATAGLIEIGARLTVFGASRLPAIFAPAEAGSGYMLAPGEHRYWHRSREVTVTVRPDGQRIVPYAPASAPKDVWVIGDSQVFGWGLNDPESIPAQMQRLLGPEYKVVNAGVPGFGPMAYVNSIRQAPDDAIKIVVFTELNDGQDVYSTETYGRAHCGILVAPEGFGSALPCWVLRSHLFSTLVDLRNVFKPTRLAPPLNCNPTVRSAAAVMQGRISAVAEVLMLYEPVITATVPWDARMDARQLDNYIPRLNQVRCGWSFPDSADLAGYLGSQSGGGDFFQRGDHHLSARGAEVVARHLAAAVRAKRQS